MLRNSPTGVHRSTESFGEHPDVKKPAEVRTEALHAAHAEAASPKAREATGRTHAVPRIRARPDLASQLNIAPAHKAQINDMCASVVRELRSTVGWDIDIREDLQIYPVSRGSLQSLLQREYHINALQAWVLTRVMGVVYLPSMKHLVVVEEMTQAWHPELLAHELAKGIVRLSLGLYANRQAALGNIEVLKFENKIDQLYTIDEAHYDGAFCMAIFQAAHAESVARKFAPTTHTPPLTQRPWHAAVWLSMFSHHAVEQAGRELADDFETILESDEDRVNRIYAHGRLTQVWQGSHGKVHIDCACNDTKLQITADSTFLHDMNPNRGSVIAQVNFGSTRAFPR